MDPVMIAARGFIDDARRVWRAGRSRVLRAVSSPDDRRDLVKALRMMELTPGNRRPFFVYEAPFAEEGPWFDGLCASLREDYEAVREGAAGEGVTLPVWVAADDAALGPSGRAAAAVRRVGAMLAGRLDGAVVALVPSQIAAPEQWRASMTGWARAPFPAEVHLALWDPPGGPLAAVVPDEAAARFAVDQDALFDHLERLHSVKSAGPAVPAAPAMTDAQRAAVEAELGRKVPSEEAGRRLRGALLQAAHGMGRQDWPGAATHYLAALTVCRDEGLRTEEVMVLVALGGLCAAVGQAERALESYALAAQGATEIALWPVVAQAWLGAAGLYLLAGDHRSSAVAYEQAAEAARREENVIVRVESLRLAGEGYTALGDDASAVRCWNAAVDEGSAAPPAERGASTWRRAAAGLLATLERHGLRAQAAHVRGLLAARGEG